MKSIAAACRPPIWAVILVALMTAGCGSTRIAVDSRADPAADFGRFRTYGWVPLSEGAAEGMKITDRRLRSEFIDVVDREMRRSGFTLVAVGDADLRLFVRGAAMETAREVGQGAYFDARYARGGTEPAWPGTDGPTGYLENSTAGAVRLTMTEAATGNVVWSSRAVIAMKGDPGRAQRSARVREAAMGMLDGFPPER